MRILLGFLLCSCLCVHAQHRLRSERLQEDFTYLITQLKEQHQGLYLHESKAETNRKLDSIYQALETPMSRLEFYETLRYVLSLTNEGHTNIALPKWNMLKLGLSKSFLPFSVKVLEDQLIITQQYGKPIEGLKKGMRITAINGSSIESILKRIYPLIPTDGHNETAKKAWVGGINFSLLYRLVYGQQHKCTLSVQPVASNTTTELTLKTVRFTKFRTNHAVFESTAFDYNQFKYEQLNDSIAYLSVPSFGNDTLAYDQWYRSVFTKIAQSNTRHLILDLQANGGGTEGNENLLFSYVANAVVQKYQYVRMLPTPYLLHKNAPDYLTDGWQLTNDMAFRGKETLYSNYYSDLGYEKPADTLVYNQKLYVLISGKTFSGGAELASLLQMTHRGIFIGEETGGVYEGNVSGYSETISLPNSHIMVDIPTVYFRLNVTPTIPSRGVFPDIQAKETISDYLSGKNTLKNKALDYIIQE